MDQDYIYVNNWQNARWTNVLCPEKIQAEWEASIAEISFTSGLKNLITTMIIDSDTRGARRGSVPIRIRHAKKRVALRRVFCGHFAPLQILASVRNHEDARPRASLLSCLREVFLNWYCNKLFGVSCRAIDGLVDQSVLEANDCQHCCFMIFYYLLYCIL